MARPRAADDFPMIRSRMLELRRDREQALAEQKGGSLIGPRRYHPGASPETEHQSDRVLPRRNQRTIR
jgi:hypothetical protein